MGLIGLAIQGVKGVYGKVTQDWDLVDDATAKAQKCLQRSLFDPIGVVDVVDVVTIGEIDTDSFI